MAWSTGFTPELKRGAGEMELTMLTDEQLLKIEQDAQNATPGPWKRSQAYGQLNIQVGPSYLLSDGDADHIANCDPQTIMELVKMARRYLWLRDESLDAPGNTPTVIESAHGWGQNRMLEGQELDEAIDAARAQRAAEGTGQHAEPE